MDFEIYGIGVVGLIVALVQFIKMIGFPQKLAPVLAVVLGVVFGFVAFGTSDPAQSVIMGLAAGLSAIGLWSGVKNTLEGMRQDE